MKNSLTNAWVTTKDVQRLINDGFAQGEIGAAYSRSDMQRTFLRFPLGCNDQKKRVQIFVHVSCVCVTLSERVRGVICLYS